MWLDVLLYHFSSECGLFLQPMEKYGSTARDNDDLILAMLSEWFLTFLTSVLMRGVTRAHSHQMTKPVHLCLLMYCSTGVVPILDQIITINLKLWIVTHETNTKKKNIFYTVAPFLFPFLSFPQMYSFIWKIHLQASLVLPFFFFLAFLLLTLMTVVLKISGLCPPFST